MPLPIDVAYTIFLQEITPFEYRVKSAYYFSERLYNAQISCD